MYLTLHGCFGKFLEIPYIYAYVYSYTYTYIWIKISDDGLPAAADVCD